MSQKQLWKDADDKDAKIDELAGAASVASDAVAKKIVEASTTATTKGEDDSTDSDGKR